MNNKFDIFNRGMDVNRIRLEKVVANIKNRKFGSDEVQFLTKYLQNTFGEKFYSLLHGKLEQQDFEKLLQSAQHFRLKKDEKLSEIPHQQLQMPLILILRGRVKLIAKLQSDQPKTLQFKESGQHLLLNDSYVMNNQLSFEDLQKGVLVEAVEESDIITFEREVFNELHGIKTANDEELKTNRALIQTHFSQLKRLEQEQQQLDMCRYFKTSQFEAGDVLTTPTSGTSDIFMVKSGRVLLFSILTPKQQTSTKFLVLKVLARGELFNEQQSLFDCEQSTYGSMVLEANTQLLRLEKQHLRSVTDEISLHELRAKSNTRLRHHKAVLRIYDSVLKEDKLIKEKLREICQKQKIEYEETAQKIEKSIVNGTIVTASYIKDRVQNVQKFNDLMKKGKTGVLGAAKGAEEGAQQQDAGLFTPGLHMRAPQTSHLTAAQKQNLMIFRSQAIGLRNGTQSLGGSESEKEQLPLAANRDKPLLEKTSITAKKDINQKLRGMDNSEALKKLSSMGVSIAAPLAKQEEKTPQGEQKPEVQTDSRGPVQDSCVKSGGITNLSTQESVQLDTTLKQPLDTDKKTNQNTTINVASTAQVPNKFVNQRKRLMGLI